MTTRHWVGVGALLDVNIIPRRKSAEALHWHNHKTVLLVPRAINAPSPSEDGDLREDRLHAVVLRTPDYLEIARREARRSAIIYYCSDDYRTYGKWDASRMERDEAALCRLATLSIFVSEALRQRAITECDLDIIKTRVVPNATEPRFAKTTQPPKNVVDLPRPIFGTAGVVSSRIDLAFLSAIAADPRAGSLALVGPAGLELEGNAELNRLRAHSKVRFLGAQPYADIPQWMAAFDVAIIPYAAKTFNHFCSPMRLYDHLAIGQPIIATLYCDQVAARGDVLTGESAALPGLIEAALAAHAKGRVQRIETWDDRVDALQKSPLAGFAFLQ